MEKCSEKKIQPEVKVKVVNLRKKREKKSQHQLYVPLTHHKEYHYIVITPLHTVVN